MPIFRGMRSSTRRTFRSGPRWRGTGRPRLRSSRTAGGRGAMPPHRPAGHHSRGFAAGEVASSGPSAPPPPPPHDAQAICAPSPPKPQVHWRSGQAFPPAALLCWSMNCDTAVRLDRSWTDQSEFSFHLDEIDRNRRGQALKRPGHINNSTSAGKNHLIRRCARASPKKELRGAAREFLWFGKPPESTGHPN